MKKFLAISILTCMAVTLSAGAFTVSTKFDANDLSFVRESTPGSGTVFFNKPEGYLTCQVQKKNDGIEPTYYTAGAVPAVGQFFLPLDKRYFAPFDVNNVASDLNVYIGFDFLYDANSNPAAQAQIGLFNTDSNNVPAYQARINSVSVVPTNLNAFSMLSEYNDGTARALNQFDITEFSITTATSYRCKLHVYTNNGKTLADYSVYSIDAAGITTLVGTVTGKVMADNVQQLYGMNAVGIRNLYAATDTTPVNTIFHVDNLYFSTEGEQAMPAPSWLVPNDFNMYDAKQVTYTHIFRPVNSDGWVQIGGAWSGCAMRYDVNNVKDNGPQDGKGYGASSMRKRGEWGSVVALYQPLETRYYLKYPKKDGTTYRSCEKIWMGFDIRWQYGQTGSRGATCVFGLFNSKSANAYNPKYKEVFDYQNCLGLAQVSGSVYVPWRANSDWGMMTFGANPTHGSTPDNTFPGCGAIADSTRWNRYMIYLHVVDNAWVMDVNVYTLDTAGNIPATPTSTGTYTFDGAANFLEGMDAFGLRNYTTGNIVYGNRNIFSYDNAYFSTVGPVIMPKPSELALNRADGNVDGVVDFKDIASFASGWLSNEDMFWDMYQAPNVLRNGKIDLQDLAVFGLYWL